MQRLSIQLPVSTTPRDLNLDLFSPEHETIQDMSRISVQDLKAQLSGIIARAEAGETLTVTRHNQPVAVLGPVQVAHVRCGTRVGLGRLRPAVAGGLKSPKGRFLAVLLDDRGDR